MENETPAQTLERIAVELSAMFPDCSAEVYTTPRYKKLTLHTPSYAAGVEACRLLGIPRWSKDVFESSGRQIHSINAKAGEVTVCIIGEGLPPTCHLETITERVPKTKTVDTGEFIEIQRTKVVCGKDAE